MKALHLDSDEVAFLRNLLEWQEDDIKGLRGPQYKKQQEMIASLLEDLEDLEDEPEIVR
jgi:hypothetical protein